MGQRRDKPTALRLPAELLERADRLARAVNHEAALPGVVTVTRHAILVAAVGEGLAALERRRKGKAGPRTTR